MDDMDEQGREIIQRIETLNRKSIKRLYLLLIAISLGIQILKHVFNFYQIPRIIQQKLIVVPDYFTIIQFNPNTFLMKHIGLLLVILLAIGSIKLLFVFDEKSPLPTQIQHSSDIQTNLTLQNHPNLLQLTTDKNQTIEVENKQDSESNLDTLDSTFINTDMQTSPDQTNSTDHASMTDYDDDDYSVDNEDALSFVSVKERIAYYRSLQNQQSLSLKRYTTTTDQTLKQPKSFGDSESDSQSIMETQDTPFNNHFGYKNSFFQAAEPQYYRAAAINLDSTNISLTQTSANSDTLIDSAKISANPNSASLSTRIDTLPSTHIDSLLPMADLSNNSRPPSPIKHRQPSADRVVSEPNMKKSKPEIPEISLDLDLNSFLSNELQMPGHHLREHRRASESVIGQSPSVVEEESKVSIEKTRYVHKVDLDQISSKSKYSYQNKPKAIELKDIPKLDELKFADFSFSPPHRDGKTRTTSMSGAIPKQSVFDSQRSSGDYPNQNTAFSNRTSFQADSAIFNRSSQDSGVTLFANSHQPRATTPIQFPQEYQQLDFSNRNLNKFPIDIIPNVTHLYLNNNFFTTIPSILYPSLQYLRVLDLSHNSLQSLPSEIQLLKNLQKLYLRNNGLQSLPMEFVHLSNLVICNLANNFFSSIHSHTFVKMQHLQILDLSDNRLQKVPSSVGLLPQLKALYLDINCFDTYFESLVNPLIRCYTSTKQYDKHTHVFSAPDRNADRHDISDIKVPTTGQGYLLRVKGYLSDVFELENGPLIKKPNHPHYPVADLQTFLINPNTPLGDATKRQRVIAEILETEKTYVDQLSTLHELYQIPLEIGNILNPIETDLIFSNTADILTLHKKVVLPGLCRLASTHGQPLGRFFTSLCPSLEMYTTYMNNFDACGRLVQHLLGKPVGKQTNSLLHYRPSESTCTQFSAFVEKTKSNPRHTQINVSSFLVLPIQRLPRYKLLMDSLLKVTASDHPDYMSIKAALRNIETLVTFCNDQKRSWDSRQQTLVPLSKVTYIIPPVGFFKQPSIFRELLMKSSTLFICKYVELVTNIDTLSINPTELCQNKRAQFKTEQCGSIQEWKFKPSKNEPKLVRQFDQGSKLSQFDVFNLTGKKSILYFLTDVIVICNADNQYVGCVSLPLVTPAEGLPMVGQRETSEAVMRITDGKCVLYVRGPALEIVQYVSLVNTL